MVVDVGRPRPVEGYESPRVDSAAEDVLGNEFAFAPDDGLLVLGVCVLAFSDLAKPLVVSVVSRAAVFEPFVDEHVGGIVVERSLD